MNAFDIGYVPEGWKRGDQLSIRSAPQDGWGYIQRPLYTLGENMHDECMLVYKGSDAPKVNAWLLWWYSKEPAQPKRDRRLLLLTCNQ